MTNWTNIITLINLVILVGTAIGGIWAFRSGKTRSEQEIQERVRQALHDENELLQSRVRRLETDNDRLKAESKHRDDMLLLVIDMLKKTRGIALELDMTNNIITFRGSDGTIQVSRLSDDTVK